MKTLIAIIKNIPDEIDTDHLDVYVRSKLYRDDFINRIDIEVKDMPRQLLNWDDGGGYFTGWNDCIDVILGETE